MRVLIVEDDQQIASFVTKGLRQAGFKIRFDGPHFNEFLVEAPEGFADTYQRLLDKKIIAGLAIESFYPDLHNHYLMCATETRTRGEIDTLLKEVSL